MSSATAKAANRETVFVVDDMKTIRDLVSIQLEQLDCSAETFASGEECIRGLGQREPRLILMDLGMAPMRGDECCRRIKENERYSHIPIVMLTGTDAAHEVMHSWRAGADDFLPKPIRRSQLASKIEAMRRWNPASPAAPNESPSRQRLLLLENRGFYRARLGGALEHAGLEILYCKDANDALQSLSAHRREIDLLICDLGSLGGDGIEPARQLKEQALPKAVMLLTSASEPTPEIEAACRQLTGHEILNKRTVPTEVILAKVNALLHRVALDIRAAERVPFFSVVEFRESSGDWLSGFAYDISTRGIFIRTMTTFPPLSKVEMKVRFFAAREDIVCRGVVAWSNPFKRRSSFSYPLGMGVGFEQLDSESEKMVVKLVKSGGRASSSA